MFKTLRKVSWPVGLLTAVALIAGVAVAGASASLTALNPETARQPVAPPPLLAPPNEAGYVAVSLGQPISAPDGRPVAQLASTPSDVLTVSVNIPATASPTTSDKVYFQVLSSVLYAGNAGKMLVTTARPSSEAGTSGWVLGNETITLPNGTTAWASSGLPTYPNRIVFINNGLIVTVAGTLPLERLQALAATVVLP